MQSASRNDFLWSEGATDSMYSIKGKSNSEGFVAPLLPSPAAQSTRTNFSYASDSSYPYFSDAVEGDDWQSGNEGDLSMTTPEKSTTLSNKNSSPLIDVQATNTAPVRPPRRTELLGAVSSAFTNSADDEGSIDYASVKTKVWMGTNRREVITKSEETAPSIPTHPLTRHLSAQSCDTPVGHEDLEDVFDHHNEDDKNHSKESIKENRLPDGTIKPKMPPIPSSVPRRERGRRNRSPVLSYADGVEEEERLEREKDLQEGGGKEVIEITSSMGPRLKKNSPAPWEMEEEEKNLSEFSSSGLRANSPPSSSSWSRPSMDSIRSRQTSQQSSPTLVNSSMQQGHFSSSPLKSISDSSSDAFGRRARSKSVSNSGGTSLKGLGLSTATPPLPSKKSSGISSNGFSATSNGKIGKAFRGMGSNVLTPNSSGFPSSTKDGSRKKQGISSDDYAHLDQSGNYPQNLEAPKKPSAKTPEGRVVSSSSSITITGQGSQANSELIPNSRSRGTSQSSSISASTTYTEISKPKTPLAERKNNNCDWNSDSAADDFKKYQAPRQTTIKAVNSIENLTVEKKRSRSNTGKSGSSVIANMPRPGSHEGVAYKLISLEEAKSQQQKQSSPEKNSSTTRKSTASEYEGNHVISHKEMQPTTRTIKTKRSGLFRMFGKDKGVDQIEASVVAVPPIPSLSTARAFHSKSREQDMLPRQELNMPEMSTEELGEEMKEIIDEDEDEIGSLPYDRASSRKGVKAFDTPALSLRPMSSMFSGLAADLLDSTAATATASSTDNLTLDDRNRLQLPNSPPQFKQRSSQSSHGSDRSHESSMTSSKRNLTRSPQPLPRRSLESMRSETSSSLGLVNGSAVIPSVPNNQDEDRLEISSSTDATQIANSTRSRALEIESKVAELLGELVKLRSNAMDTGLLSPIMAKSTESYTQESSQITSSASNGSSPQFSTDVNNNATTLSPMPTSPALQSTSPLLDNTIAPCSSCGCNCADQKRLQAINEIAVLKNISILDRGRALKSVGTTANVGKFGSYLHR